MALGYNRACAVTHPVNYCDVEWGANPTFSTGSKTFLMAGIYPFRAWRYNPSAVKLDDCSHPAVRQNLAGDAAGLLQAEPLQPCPHYPGLPELFDAERGESVYSRAARDFRAWREQGILVQEKDPCILAYSQRFTVPGSNVVKERRGFIALGKLHDYAEKVVFRHEYTLSKPKSDRLNLLKATHAHFGQIFMLYSDPAASVEKILYDGNSPAEVEVTDEYGVLHRLWKVSDPATIRLLTTAMADKKLIIADGHHRYETALNYSKEHAAGSPAKTEHSTNQLPQPAFPEAAVMMTFVNMDADGLVILPTHRVVYGLGIEDTSTFTQAKEFFTVDVLPEGDAESYLDTLKAQKGTAFVAVTRQCCIPDVRKARSCRSAGRAPGAPAPARPQLPAHYRSRPASRPRRRKGARANQYSLSSRRR